MKHILLVALVVTSPSWAESPRARVQQADQKVQALGLNEAQQAEFYAISSEVFQRLAQDADGDTAKMEEIMLSAQSNPKAFYEKYFTAAEKAKIQSLGTAAAKKK